MVPFFISINLYSLNTYKKETDSSIQNIVNYCTLLVVMQIDAPTVGKRYDGLLKN